MTTSLTPEQIATALKHLRRRDPQLKSVMTAVGPFRMQRHTNRYRALLRAILSQQISGAAAQSIWRKVEQAAGTATLTPQAIHELTDEQLRACGLSPQKLKYVRDLTERVHSKELRLTGLHRRSDAEVIEALTAVNGIGVWTAQMFLMFSLQRPDVLPHGDLGIQSAMKRLYGLADLPGRSECEQLAAPWRPWCTVACWYLWRSLELPPVK